MRNKHRAKLGWRDQDGFNLVTALIMVSLLALIIFLVSQSQVLSMRATSSVRASAAYEDIIQPFQSAMTEKLRAHFNVAAFPGCPRTQTFASGVIGGAFTFTLPSSFLPTAQEPKSMTATKEACKVPSFADGRFKFCLALTPVAASEASENKMTSMKDILAQLDIELLNVQDNVSLGCQAFYDGKQSYAARVNYTLHWLYAPKNQTSPLHKRRHGSFYAIL